MATLAEDIDLLSHSRSPKRRAGAKRLRKRGDATAGPALLSALKREVEDPRTWETQYQLVMAIGECGYSEALPFLRELASRDLKATMIYVGLGDALVRLEVRSNQDASAVLRILESGNDMLIDGALRAMAMLRMVPSQRQIEEILQYASSLPADSGNRFWPLAAAPGWYGDVVDEFVAECAKSDREDLRTAASLASSQKYRKWRPL